MKKYDCTKTLDYSHELKRMCEVHTKCEGCPFKNLKGCAFVEAITQKHMDIVQKWSDEHPEPKLTERDYSFLDCFNPTNKYIKRQCGVLTVIWHDPTLTINQMEISIDATMFKFVEQGQKWSFDDLRKLEVEE